MVNNNQMIKHLQRCAFCGDFGVSTLYLLQILSDLTLYLEIICYYSIRHWWEWGWTADESTNTCQSACVPKTISAGWQRRRR